MVEGSVVAIKAILLQLQLRSQRSQSFVENKMLKT